MNFYVSQVINLLILFVGIVGWVKFKSISPTYYPFIILIWVGTVNEVYSAVIINFFGKYNIINLNLYWLAEAVLMLWQFKVWNLFGSLNRIYNVLLILFIGSWLTETIMLSKLHLEFNSYFKILYAFISVLLSISMINQTLMKEKDGLAKNSIFIICIGFVFMLTYSLLTELFYVYRLELSDTFNTNLHYIFIVINFFCNLLYILAILWMPKKQAFTLQY
jgi:hypothetical protein